MATQTANPEIRTRARRPSGEVRSLIVEAARSLFLAQGYEATTTKEIAERAGVSERLLFSNFGSKSELFEVAVLAPFAELVADYAASWEREAEGLTPASRIERFVSGLFDLADENRAVLRSALGASSTNGPEAQLLDHLAQTLQTMQPLARSVSAERGYRIDPPATIAAATSMVFGMVLLDDLLFPAGTRKPSRARLTSEVTQMIAHGALERPEGD